MSLYEAFNHFLEQHVRQLRSTYLWGFSTERLPITYTPPASNDYENSLDLRQHLYNAMLSNPNCRNGIQQWYVKEWGGVRSNRRETLEKYCELSAPQLIALGSKGIASWSKMLSIRDPYQYCIYDARVAFSLNAIQVVYGVRNHLYFPLLPSRNTLITSAQSRLKRLMSGARNQSDFYNTYNKILKNYSESTQLRDMQSAEMVLFSEAPRLASQIQNLALD